MTMTLTKTNFTAGELSVDMLGRGDLTAYANGAKTLTNVSIAPVGGVSRRAGLRYVGSARGYGRLLAFEFNTEQTYLLVFTHLRVEIFADGVPITHLVTPWSTSQIRTIKWTQTADTLLVVHPNIPPQKITRSSNTTWRIEEWTFYEENGISYPPYHKFADDTITMAATSSSGHITLTASADVFEAEHEGKQFLFKGKPVKIAEILSGTQARADVLKTLTTLSTRDWEEPAFSTLHGWPSTVCFHQDRLVIGGSRDLPNRLWMSKSSDLFNFDLGTGLDDESIEFALLSDQVNAIVALFSGRHLQVFTSGAEWMVSGSPLTPGNIQLLRQTRVGSPVDRWVPPRDVDGATLFVSRNGRDLREFIYADIEQAYQSTDLSMLAKHMMVAPVDQDYDAINRLFYVVMGDGTLGTVTIFRTEKVTAWTRQHTDGKFLSVAVCEGIVYVMVERNGTITIECFDANYSMDCALKGESTTAKSTWSGLGHLNGRSVQVLADQGALETHVVSNGAITLTEAAKSVQVGLPFTHVIEPLPPVVSASGSAAPGIKVRMVRAHFRLLDSQALHLDTGNGVTPIAFGRFGSQAFDAGPPVFSGDVQIRAIGWKRDAFAPLWRISQSVPLPCTILAVATDVKISE